MSQGYNKKCPAVKRIMKEAKELQDPTYEYTASPLEDNLFEWHFTFRGPEGTSFEGGIYHGRIVLPPEYPFKPPNILLLNQNGRFETHKKICLSISGYHPETWQPSWSIRTAILAIIAFMTTKGEGSIGALDYSEEERKKLAKKSVKYSCSQCGQISNLVLDERPAGSSSGDKDEKLTADEKLVSKIQFSNSKKATNVAATQKKEEEKKVDDGGGSEAKEAAAAVVKKETTGAASERDSTTIPAPEPEQQQQSPSTSPSSAAVDEIAIMRRRPASATSNDTALDVFLHVVVFLLINVIFYLVYRRVSIVTGFQ